MSTPRKRLPNVALEQLKAADQAIAFAADLSRQASRKREEAERLLIEIEDMYTIQRNPGKVVQVLAAYALKRAKADKLDADVRTALAEAGRYLVAAQYAHRLIEDE